MVRSRPPAAINASMAASTASTIMTRQTSDLPLRNYPTSSSPGLSSPAATHSTPNVSAPPPEALSSSIAVESGGGTRDANPSSATINEVIYEAHSLYQPRSRTPSRNNGKIQGPVRSNTLTTRRSPSQGRPGPFPRRDLSPTAQALNEKVHKYLYSMNPPSHTEELVKENRSLHQRIAALQRTETDLLNENQDLARKLSSTQKRYETRRQHWKEELAKWETVFEARIKDLESRLAEQEEELARIALDRSRETGLNDTAITSWFAAKETAWREWVDDFAHQDPNRVQSGLHPLQLRELCEGVKDFVRLTDKGELPEELLAPPDNDGVRTARLLLHGMLANFIVSETLESPFWVFDVISTNPHELESPSVPRLNSMSPVGFRMDLAMWNFSIAPPLPGGNQNANAWRTSLMKAFCEGGMSTEIDSVLLTDDSHLLAEARVRHAGRLKDSFLRGPARFLLQDQEAAGIEKLERRLVQEIDAALRFSCQLWCRQGTLQVRRLRDLADTAFNSTSDNMQLCQAQAPLRSQPTGRAVDSRDASPGYHDDHSVIMVVQPSVGVSMSSGTSKPSKDAKGSTRIWAKASVLVATPNPPMREPPPPPPAQATASPDTASVKAMVGTPISLALVEFPKAF
ncbi:hypothetical protein C8A01DRAFT_16192 [Parachaetomium inaequale]|uniref:Uncharacterized protein n=1 Tax=Parachaetomium inaequale TaxID=2588326 RepID=A0AAN6PF85_9PEZI|nr:hypothetical protein C8A01DRAFT_16192 [Parachaetomium inaequale]